MGMKKKAERQGSIRKAGVRDIKEIQQLINKFARQDLMLPRALNELYENIRDFWVYERNGRVIGCCALHICWEELAEIKSLAVERGRWKQGIGKKLVETCIEDAVGLGAESVFVLTYQPGFFEKMGFRRVSHSKLPHKIWAECIHCPKFPDCKEVALLRKL
jgi:amino-acid N-acetyltransferase